jgi:hypothetical protein
MNEILRECTRIDSQEMYRVEWLLAACVRPMQSCLDAWTGSILGLGWIDTTALLDAIKSWIGTRLSPETDRSMLEIQIAHPN